MRHYEPGEHRLWEDSYRGVLHPSFEELWAVADEYWMSGLAAWNLPVWIHYDAENEQEYDCGPTVQVGVVLTRHGETVVHVAPAALEQVRQLQDVLARVWFQRADVGFPRYAQPQQAES